jgi:CheY-like chemotaxis protein
MSEGRPPIAGEDGAGARTILLVEDEPDAVVLLRRAFSKASVPFPIRHARDGEEAVEYLSGLGVYGDRARHPLPSIILLDLRLPRRSGFEVLEWLRARPDIGRIPVIVLTTSEQPRDRRRARELGANGFRTKPVEPKVFCRFARAVDRYVRRVGRKRGPPARIPVGKE